MEFPPSHLSISDLQLFVVLISKSVIENFFTKDHKRLFMEFYPSFFYSRLKLFVGESYCLRLANELYC